jgi:hypothetical protein
MSKRMHEMQRIVLQELGAAGIKPQVEHSHRHMKFQWEHNGEARTVIASSTYSDWRALKKQRSFVRRVLRADGVLS